MSSEITYVDAVPDRIRRKPGRWEDRIASELSANPGHWAIVRRGESFQKIGPYVTFLKRAGLEATSRRVDDNECAVFARYPEEES